jgi:class 3 adenylate cyclase/tetratricopeptide (TPR) repeat protein
MVCSSCGTTNEAGRKFCKECGAPLALLCNACGAANAPDSKFCGECGSAFAPPVAAAVGAASPAARPAGQPTTERRWVSVLFADLVGSTALAERRDAEDTRELLSRYFDVARDVIERHGGLVEKFIGDAVMAVWGTPVAYEDDAERAVRTGLELVDAVEGLGRVVGVKLQARAGVLTGEAAATVGAVSQGIVAGDMVNTASRIQSAADPGSVLVGEATYHAAARAIAFEDVGELTLKGKNEPVRAWRALRVVGERGGANRATLEPPFVGRTDELRLIKDLLHATEREHKARLISVTGIAGIGKSRLAWEFLKYIDGLSENVYWHRGRCPAYGDGLTFWALGEMVRMRARIAETETPADSRRKLAETLEEYVPDAEERRWIEPRLAHLLGLVERTTGEREELFSAWRTFFERIAGRGVITMVFEDIQWADAGLLDFIESTLEWSRAHPILIVTLSRPELADKRPDWGAGQRSFTSVHLEPLEQEPMAELVRNYVRGAPEDAVARIVERSEGVPLYAVETVRMLADRGALTAREDTYELVGDLGTLEIPETLQALIAARLDALQPEDRALLQDAAVLGKAFTVDSLAAVAETDRTTLDPRLRDLVRKEFLVHEADPRSPERGQYSFVQSLIREIAYGMLSKADRRRRHLATAHHLESVGDEELAGAVATHYVEAFRSTPAGPDADALAARARDWLGQAAERATSLGSPDQALGFAEQALAITLDGPERASLLYRAGEAAAHATKFEHAILLLEEAIERYRAAGDLGNMGRATALIARPLFTLERRAEAMARLKAALEELGDEGNDRARAELLIAVAGGSMAIGASDDTIGYVEQALPLLESLDLPELLEEAMTSKALWMMSVGRNREATMLFQGALAVADEIGNQRARADALLMLGIVAIRDDPRESLRCNLESLDASRKAGVGGIELTGLGNGAEAAIDIGEWATADSLLTELRSRPDPSPGVVQSIALLDALLHGYRGEIDDARRALATVADDLESTDMVMARTWYLRARSLVSLMEGDLDAAYTEGMAAAAGEPAGGNAPLSLWSAARAAFWLRDREKAVAARGAMDILRGRWIENCRRAIDAGIAALEGRTEDAATGYAQADETWLEMALPLDRAYCVIDAASVLPADTVRADAIASARTYLETLGAAPLARRLAAFVREPAVDALNR